MSINRVVISGNLTRDSELRSTASGMAVLGFGVAVNDRRKNPQTGEWEDYPNFIDCTMFGTRASSLYPHLSKGTKVTIEGKLRWSQWERDGQKRSKIEVIVDDLEFMSSRNSNSASQAAPASSSYGTGSSYGSNAGYQQGGSYNNAYGGGYGNAYGGGYGNAYGSQAPATPAAPAAPAAPVIDASSSVYDEDIPF